MHANSKMAAIVALLNLGFVVEHAQGGTTVAPGYAAGGTDLSGGTAGLA